MWSHYAAAAKSRESCPTLSGPIDGSPPGSLVPGILQAQTLEWVAISFSNAWKWKVKGKSLNRIWLLAAPWTAAYQPPPSMGFSREEYWSGVPSPSPGTTLRYSQVTVYLIPDLCKALISSHESRWHSVSIGISFDLNWTSHNLLIWVKLLNVYLAWLMAIRPFEEGKEEDSR